MKITFHINYHTSWGETLFLYGSLPALGGGDPLKAVPLHLEAPDSWKLEIETGGDPGEFDYHYIVKSENGHIREEWGKPHSLRPAPSASDVMVFDSWHDMPADKPFFSSAFVNGMLHRKLRDLPLNSIPATLTLRVEAPLVAPEDVLVVTGEGDVFGNWNPLKGIRFNDARFPVWEASIPLSAIGKPFDYKFATISKDGKTVTGWENRDNRHYGITPETADCQIVVSDLRYANPWGEWKAAGTAIPVFSIRSEEDWGVGDFLDLKKMIDWCRLTGQKVLQLLPVNDTIITRTWVDSYPYRANSTFALHPMFLRPDAAGRISDKGRREHYAARARELNKLAEIDYEKVNELKEEYMRELYAEQFTALSATPEYKKFVERNDYWLMPYAVWSALRDEYHTADNALWGDMAVYSREKAEAYRKAHSAETGFWYFVQYHLDRQLREMRDYAHNSEVVLKGDIPIGIGRLSVDAWTDPHLFNMDAQAGAPPDDFSVLGQNWGFPTYNWEEMARDGFTWWKNRFRKMSEYFDAYRIDHILGFFRIWQIPLDAVHGLLGYFNPALPYSADEMRVNYDFWINPDLQCNPLALEWMLPDFFGDYAQEVKEKYLYHIGGDRYGLKEEFNTQAKVQAHFTALEKNGKNNRIAAGLMGLIADVLFIEDPYQRGHYHPRISAQFTYQYRILDDYQKGNFNRLYNDFFYRRHNEFWKGKALWKLPPLLDATSMLACAEDLGMIPACVPSVMHDLRILSLEIQRMPKDPASEFGDTWHYPYFSVCTTSTHDMSGIRAWWESDREMSARFFRNVLHDNGEVPYFAEPWVCEKIVDLQLKSPSMLCILPLQDWLSTDGALRRENPADEQINEPANPTHYWRYRMHLTTDSLLDAYAFNSYLKNAIRNSGR